MESYHMRYADHGPWPSRAHLARASRGVLNTLAVGHPIVTDHSSRTPRPGAGTRRLPAWAWPSARWR
eukprot:scaffold47655_cov58-Phaeocystis_antarctica.AAC.3